MVPDFSGWATVNNLKCSDGRVIMNGAFKHQDQQTVPLVWQHRHDDIENVLGHAILENREEGVYARAFFNSSPKAQLAKEAVKHGDIESLSIWANQLVEKSKNVLHGVIKEVSLVLSGANPGAFIDNINLQHGDTFTVLSDEAEIYTGRPIIHGDDDDADKGEDSEGEEKTHQEILESLTDEQREVVHELLGEALEHANKEGDSVANATGEKTVKEVFDSMTEEQRNVVYYLLGEAEDNVEHADNDNENNSLQHNEEGSEMTRNTFDQNGGKAIEGTVLSHSDLERINNNAQRLGSLKEAFLEHAQTYGITDIDILFPDAKALGSQPELLARRTEWVKTVLDGTKHTPFSRIKSIVADLTAEEARAKGYVKGNLKKDEIVKLLKRITTPTTVYKKQKLDRDDIVDITEIDVVAWLKWEMRFMLEEELARAILIGDGREPDDDDKINEDNLRPIAYDDDMYAHKVNVPANVTGEALEESILRSRTFYKGTGTPTMFTTDTILIDLLLRKDKMGRRLYGTVAEIAAALRVDRIVVVEAMETQPDLLAIIVNLSDYTIGADKGGETSMFDDFDIDYNQHKYLIETRISGALTKPKSAVIISRTSGTTVTPQVPTFDQETNTITIPTQAGVAYYDITNPLAESLVAAGPYVIDETTDIEARALTGYNFPHNTDADWTYAYVA